MVFIRILEIFYGFVSLQEGIAYDRLLKGKE